MRLTPATELRRLAGAPLADSASTVPKPWGECYVCHKHLGARTVTLDAFESDSGYGALDAETITSGDWVARHVTMLSVLARHAACQRPHEVSKPGVSWRASSVTLPFPDDPSEKLPIVCLTPSGDHMSFGASVDDDVRDWPDTLMDAWRTARFVPALSARIGVPENTVGSVTVFPHENTLRVNASMGEWDYETTPDFIGATQALGGLLLCVSYRYDATEISDPETLTGFMRDTEHSAHGWVSLNTSTPSETRSGQ